MEAIRSVYSGGYCNTQWLVYMYRYLLITPVFSTSGRNLVTLWNAPFVQAFFNCVPYQTLLIDKGIYYPGTLRLVSYTL